LDKNEKQHNLEILLPFIMKNFFDYMNNENIKYYVLEIRII